MHPDTSPDLPLAEAAAIRQVFPAWSICVPVSFVETFVEESAYWHAYDARRSVSLTSFLIVDGDGPVPAGEIRQQMPPMQGAPVDELPPGLLGWAVIRKAVQPARASRSLSGMLAAHGRLLIVTITSNDLAWMRRTWLSIGVQAAAPDLWPEVAEPIAGRPQ